MVWAKFLVVQVGILRLKKGVAPGPMVTCTWTHILIQVPMFPRVGQSESLSKDMHQTQVRSLSKGQKQHQQQQKERNPKCLPKACITLSIVSTCDVALQWPCTKWLWCL